MNEESQEEMLARVRAAQDKLNSNKKKVKGLKGEIEVKKTKKPEKGFYSEERYKRPKELKKFDQFVRDAAGKEGREKIDGMNKARVEHDKVTKKAKEK